MRIAQRCMCLRQTTDFGMVAGLSFLKDIRDFKQIATADANTAAGSKFPPKGDTAHVRRLQPAVA